MVFGAIAGVALFVPFVAFIYRREGYLSFWRWAGWSAALVYFWAIWTYTLFPLPEGEVKYCVPPNFNPGDLFTEIAKAFSAGGNPLVQPATLQLLLNVALFVPLGVFMRVLIGRGVVTATIVGFLLSLLVEVTQLTGVYGIYNCAYRMFDVVDLMTNTAGALLGALIALLLPKAWMPRKDRGIADEPRPVTKARKLLAMLCDLMLWAAATTLINVVIVLAADIVFKVESADLNPEILRAAITLIWIASVAVVVLCTGRTPGDIIVRLEYRGGKMPELLARGVRFAVSLAGVTLLGLLPGGGQPAAFILALALIVSVFFTRNARALSGIVAGRELVDSREARLENAAIER